MTATRPARSAPKPVAGRRVSRPKRRTAKPLKLSVGKSLTTRKTRPSKKTQSKSPKPKNTAATSPAPDIAAAQPAAKAPRPVRTRSAKLHAAVAARQATMATTTRHVGDDAPVAVDDHDEAAKAGVKRQRARKASARRKD